jgi:hypothetical protein
MIVARACSCWSEDGAGDGNRTRVASLEVCSGPLALGSDLGGKVQGRALVDRPPPWLVAR